MQILTLIRGLPGAGKSTLAKQITAASPNTVHIEADMYFENEEGVYVFNPHYVVASHDWCTARCNEALQKGQSVVIANTFTQKWEMLPYINMANDFDAKLVIVIVKGNFKSIHNVPNEKIAAMAARWED